jgi:hypothetical protein
LRRLACHVHLDHFGAVLERGIKSYALVVTIIRNSVRAERGLILA